MALLVLSTIVFSSGIATAQGYESTFTNSIGMKFVLIPAGTFMMGGDKRKEKPYKRELPAHQVTISKPFYLSAYELTQTQWEDMMGYNPSMFKGKNNPVEIVSWLDAQDLIKELNRKEGHSRYRLPTEAEWEYAARAGTTTAFYFGSDEFELGAHAWFLDNSQKKTHPVGKKGANPWGLYDMLGNVWEFTGDWLDGDYYASSPSVDPTGPPTGTRRVVRGCGFISYYNYCRSAFRDAFEEPNSNHVNGIRLAISTE
jgi:formylglycine-generating enzyme required for sulfatase activity